MPLPGADRAFIDPAKLADYCLSSTHPKGRHKARVFASATGLDRSHGDFLRAALLEAARTANAQMGDHDEYGQRYVVDFLLAGPKGQATVRSTWIVKAGEDFPRFVTCWIV